MVRVRGCCESVASGTITLQSFAKFAPVTFSSLMKGRAKGADCGEELCDGRAFISSVFNFKPFFCAENKKKDM